MIKFLTLSQYNSFISWELCLDRLGGEVLSALPQIPLRAAKTTEPPEVGPVTARCFRESVLDAGQLLRSVDKQQEDKFLVYHKLMECHKESVTNLAQPASTLPVPEDITWQ